MHLDADARSAATTMTASVVTPISRVQQLDAARFFAAVGIVWLHTMEISPQTSRLGELGRFAVPFFSLVAIAMMARSMRRTPNQSWSRYSWNRIVRIAGPFLIWTAIYVV